MAKMAKNNNVTCPVGARYLFFAVFLLLAAGQAEAADRYWILASGTGNWSDTANWSTLSGGAGGASVPGTADIAQFNGGADGTKDGNCTIDAVVDVAGINIASAYNGTITQGTNAVTIGASHYVQAGGTFTGGGTITASGDNNSAVDWTVSGGTFNANGGTVIFQGLGSTVTGSHTLANVTLAKATGYQLTIASGTTLTVTGPLTLTDGALFGAGTITAQGDVTVGANYDGDGSGNITISGTANQTLTGTANAVSGRGLDNLTINKTGGILTLSGTLDAVGNWTYTAGTLSPGTSTVRFSGGSRTLTGSHTLTNVTLAMATYQLTIASGTTLTVTGPLTLTDGALFGAGTVVAQGDVTVGANYDGAAGGGNITISGTANQTLTGTANVGYPSYGLNNLTINKTGGTLTLSGTLDAVGNWTYTAGTLSPGTSAVRFAYGSSTVTGSHTLNNVTVNKDGVGSQLMTIASGTALTVTGALTLTDGAVDGPGTVTAQGNLTIDSTFDGGSVAITLSGTGNQTATRTSPGVVPTGNWTINKSAGTVTLGSSLGLSTAGQDLTITAGTLDMASYTLTVNDVLTNNGTITSSGSGQVITAGTLTTGSSSSQITFNGVAADTAVTLEDGTYGNLTVNNAGTTFSLSGATTVQTNLTLSGGTLDATTSNYALTVGGNWTNSGAFTARSGTVTLNGINQTLSGATPFYNLTKSVTAVSVLTLPAGVTTTVQNQMNLFGASGNLLIIRSSTSGTAAPLTLSAGTANLCYLDVQDSDASGGLGLTGYSSTNAGNNTNWTFASSSCGSTGLVAHWKFDNNANDSVGTYNGTLQNGATFTTSISPGAGLSSNTHALLIDAVDDYATMSAVPVTRPVTIALWYYGTGNNNGWRAFIIGAGSGFFINTSNTLSWWDGVDKPGNTALSLNTWYHLAVTIDSSQNVTFYVNGASDGTATTAGANLSKIGADSVNLSQAAGYIDDLRVYNRVLSTSEIKSLSNRGGTGILTLQDADAVPTTTTVTNSATVTAAFTSVESGATAYVLSNTSGSFGGTTAVPGTSFSTSWTMPSGDGEKTVYARITKSDSTTYDISDTITLDTTPPAAPSGLTLTANSDNTGFTATVTAPSADVTKLHWRYVSLGGNVAANYPATYTSGTALGAGVTTGVSAGVQYTIIASSLAQFNTYGVRVWAEDAAGNVSTLNAQASLYLSPPTPRLVVTAPNSATSAAAGDALTLTITAKDANGSVITTYAGPYSLTWTPTGAAATTLVSSSSTGWSAGVTTTAVTIGGASAGTGTFTATDGSGTGLTNGTLPFTFYPASFTVAADAASQTAGKAFNLTVTAKDSAGQTVTRYAGTVALSLSATPTATKSLNVASVTVTAGTATKAVSYPDCASTATITGKDTTYATGVTIQGTSSELKFHPAKFEVVVGMPPPHRTVWYLNELVTPVKVKALADDGTVTANYRGTVKFATQTGLSLPSDYAFTAGDAGLHEFTGLMATATGAYTVSVSDSAQATATGTSGNFTVIQANVVVATVSGPVGTLSVPVKIVDAAGNIVPDDSTTFTVMLTEAQPNGSATVKVSNVRFLSGQAQLSLTDSEAEKVTVSGTTGPPVLSVTSGLVEFGSSSSAYSSSFQYVTYEQAPGSYTISPYSYPAGTTPYSTTTSPYSTATFTTGTTSYDSGVYTGLKALQSGVYTVSPTGTYSFTNPAGSTFSYNPTAGVQSFTNPAGSTFSYNPTAGSAQTPGSFVFSPAAMQAGMSGLPPGMAAMMGSYFSGTSGQGGGDFSAGRMPTMPAWMSGMSGGDFSGGNFSGKQGEMGTIPAWMSGMSGGDFSSGQMSGQMPAWMGDAGGMPAWMGNAGGMPAWMGDAGGMPAWMQGPGASEADEEEEKGDGAGAGEEGTAEDAVVSDEAASQEAVTSDQGQSLNRRVSPNGASP